MSQAAKTQRRPVVLIGPMSADPVESVSSVNRAFMHGLEDRYEFISLESTRTHGNTRQASLNVVNCFYFLQQLFRWIKHLLLHRPAIAHYAISSGWAMEKGLWFMKLARMAGARTIGHLHSGGFPDHWQSLPKARKWFAEREFLSLDGLVLASEWWRGEIRNHVPLPPDKLFVVNNPINYQFEEPALQIPVERPKTVVLALGVMGRPKGIMEIVEAAKIVSQEAPLDLRIAGSEREPGILKRVNDFVAANSLEESVTVTPSIVDDDKNDLFRKSSIFLLPSHFENFPLVVLEAAAAGMAIVVTRVGAVPEFFEDGVSARFVDIGNAEQLAEVILDLISHPEKCIELGRAAREVFQSRLSRDKIMDTLDDVYRQVLPHHRPAWSSV